MTRVAIVIDSLQLGGAQRLVEAFTSRASEYDIQPVIINLRNSSSPIVLDAIRSSDTKVITVTSNSLFNIKRLRWMIRFLKEQNIEIIQTHLLYANMLGSVAAHFAKIPVVCTLHSTHIEKGWRSKLLKRMEDFCLRHFATRILAVGDIVAAAHHKHYDSRTVDVIPNGIPEPGEIPMQARNRLRNEIVGNDSSSIIITVGRFERPKGYEDMINAFSLLRQKDSNSVLLMVGSGSLKENIQTQIEKLHLNHSVILTGERRDIPQLLAASDIFASSSHREGMPLSLLEAMMAGLPVVATSVGDIPKIVTDEIGLVVPPRQPAMLAAALEELLVDPAKRRDMGKAAKRRALNEYSVDMWMKRHVTLYKEILTSR